MVFEEGVLEGYHTKGRCIGYFLCIGTIHILENCERLVFFRGRGGQKYMSRRDNGK